MSDDLNGSQKVGGFRFNVCERTELQCVVVCSGGHRYLITETRYLPHPLSIRVWSYIRSLVCSNQNRRSLRRAEISRKFVPLRRFETRRSLFCFRGLLLMKQIIVFIKGLFDALDDWNRSYGNRGVLKLKLGSTPTSTGEMADVFLPFYFL